MDNLEAIIKAAAETVLNGTGTYTYARKAEFNLDHDKPAPHIVFFPPNRRVGAITGAFNCLFMICEPYPDDETRDFGKDVITRMQTLWEKFYTELDKHDLVQLAEKDEEDLPRRFQGRYTGIGARVTITVPLALEC